MGRFGNSGSHDRRKESRRSDRMRTIEAETEGETMTTTKWKSRTIRTTSRASVKPVTAYVTTKGSTAYLIVEFEARKKNPGGPSTRVLQYRCDAITDGADMDIVDLYFYRVDNRHFIYLVRNISRRDTLEECMDDVEADMAEQEK